MPRFDRVYRLVAGKGGSQGVEIVPPLRLKFDISKTDDKNPNRSRITVYNLKKDTRTALEAPDTRCVFAAGYAEESGPVELFVGEVIEAYSQYELPDIATVLELGEGVKAIRDGMVSLGYPKGASARAALSDVAAKMGLSLVMPSDAPDKAWQNGFSYHGAGRNALDQITRFAGLSWSIQGRTLQIVRTGGNTNRQVFDLSASSGLVGTPERVRKNRKEAAANVTDEVTKTKKKADTKTEAADGWRVRSLLLPSVVPGDRVKLSSRTVEGVFTIKELQHQGDTHGGPWQTELLLIDASQSPRDARHRAPAPTTAARQSNAGGPLPVPLPPPPMPEAPPLAGGMPAQAPPVVAVPGPAPAVFPFPLGEGMLA